MFDIIPQSNPDGARRLLRPEFRTALTQQLQINMTDQEFDRLWQVNMLSNISHNISWLALLLSSDRFY